MRPRPYKRGDPFSAKRLNDLVREAKSSREIRASGPGLNNEAMGNQVFNTSPSDRRLVVAIEDFSVPEHPTDFYDKIDKVPSAKCLMLRLNSEADYQEETRSVPFRVYDPISKVNGSSTMGAGQAFWCFFNSDTKRWEVGSGLSGETQVINFQIVSSDPTTRSALVQIEQRAFLGKVFGSFLEDTVVYVYDTLGCNLNEPNEDLTGRFGQAVLMYVDDAAAELHFADQYEPPEKYWVVMNICCPQIVCED